MKLRIGTRGSQLALTQAEETKTRLITAHGLAQDQVEIVVIKTTGDQIRDRPLAEIGGKGLFTKELEEALLAGSVDLAVHSMKDMPARFADDFEIAALLPRQDPRDAFISVAWKSLDHLPEGARLGSSSVRRVAQALRHRSDLTVLPFRGNVETRLRKLDEGVADATFLACAGLNRLGMSETITAIMPTDIMLPAVAQGAIGIETLRKSGRIKALLAPLNDADTAAAISCERAFLATLEGSCKTPIAGHATLNNGTISFSGETLTLDGNRTFRANRTGAAADAHRLGRDAAAEVKENGGSLVA